MWIHSIWHLKVKMWFYLNVLSLWVLISLEMQTYLFSVLWTQFDSCTWQIYAHQLEFTRSSRSCTYKLLVVIPASHLWFYLPPITYAFCYILFHFSLFSCVASSVFPTPFFFCHLCFATVSSLCLYFSMSHTFFSCFLFFHFLLNKQGTFNRTLFQYVTRVNWKWK